MTPQTSTKHTESTPTDDRNPKTGKHPPKQNEAHTKAHSTQPDPPVGEPATGLDHPRQWTINIPAPYVKPVRKRKTGKMFQRKPWLNSNDRDHWRVTSPIRADWRENAAVTADWEGLPKGLLRVQIDGLVVKPRAGRFDAMNFYPTAKACVDGLIDYGLCVDDDNEHVVGPFLENGGKGPAALVLFVTEIVSTDHTENRC